MYVILCVYMRREDIFSLCSAVFCLQHVHDMLVCIVVVVVVVVVMVVIVVIVVLSCLEALRWCTVGLSRQAAVLARLLVTMWTSGEVDKWRLTRAVATADWGKRCRL